MASNISINTTALGIAWQSNEVYRVIIDDGFVEQDGGLRLPVTGGLLTTFTTNSFPPKIGNTSPTHTTTASGGFTTISFGIDRANLTILGGNVSLNLQGSPNVTVKTITVSNVAGQGNVVAMNIVGNIIPSQPYFVTMDANIFQDRDGYRNAAITNSNTFRFTSPTVPLVSNTIPANNTTANKGFTNLIITFDRNITANIGNIYLYKANTNALIKTFPITSVPISNGNITLNIVGNIEANQNYYIRSNAAIVKDATLFNSAISGNIFTFTSPTNPFVVQTDPINGAILANTNIISLNFDRDVSPNQGNIYILDNTNTIINSYNVINNITQSDLSNISINVGSGLSPSTTYRIIANANIVQDNTLIQSNISGNILTFTSVPAPTILSTYPTNGNLDVLENETISLTIDQPVTINVGNVYLNRTSDNQIIKIFNNSNVTTSGGNLYLSILGKLDPSTSYYVTSESNSIQNNLFGFKLPAITSSSTFSFTTKQEFSRDFPNIFQLENSNLLGETSYQANSYSLTFKTVNSISNISLAGSTTIGQFIYQGNIAYPEGHTGWPSGYTSPAGTGTGGGGAGGWGGYIGGNNTAGPGKTSDITGNVILYSLGGSAVPNRGSAPANQGFGGNVGYFGGSGVVILRYQPNYSNATASGGTITTFRDYVVHKFTANGTFTITSTSPTIVEYLIIGGGGGGGVGYAAGGGGAGGYKESSIEITSGSYSITVGEGGTKTPPIGNYETTNTPPGTYPGGALPGGDSSAFGIIAHGGGKGGDTNHNNVPGATAGGIGGSGGGSGASNYFGGVWPPTGQTYGDTYTNTLGYGEIVGNLQQINSYLNNITSIGTINNNPFNIYYQLSNGQGEFNYRVYNNFGNLVYASNIKRTLSSPTITNVTMVNGNTIANISYTASQFNDGSMITSYTAISNVSSISSTVNQSGSGYIVLSGLVPTTQEIKIYSTNNQGRSANSIPYIIVNPIFDGAASAYFPATSAGTYLQTTLNTAFATGNWTYEAWVYNTDTNNNTRPIFEARSVGGSSSGWLLRQNSQGWLWLRSGTGSDVGFAVDTGRNNNSWQHIALVRSGSTVTLFVDGISVASATTGTNYSDNGFRLGAFIDDTNVGSQFRGYIDEVRISDIARYTSNFTVPFEPYISDVNTKLLLHFTTFADSSSFNRTINPQGSVSISTTNYRY